jgi:hypothetical protein
MVNSEEVEAQLSAREVLVVQAEPFRSKCGCGEYARSSRQGSRLVRVDLHVLQKDHTSLQYRILQVQNVSPMHNSSNATVRKTFTWICDNSS